MLLLALLKILFYDGAMPPQNPYESVMRRCTQPDVPYWLMAGVSYETSKFQPAVRGAAGEIGLFQLMPQYFSACGDLFDPATNACCGADGIQKQIDRARAAGAPTRRDAQLIGLFANNMGWGNVGWKMAALAPPKTFERLMAAHPIPSKEAWVWKMWNRAKEYRSGESLQWGLVLFALAGAGLILYATVR